MQTRVLRRKIRDLYDDAIDALSMELNIRTIKREIKVLRDELIQLERSIDKNAEYEGLIWKEPSGYKVEGTVIGLCKHCDREVFSGQRVPDPKEEGLFCNYYCRRVYRNNSNK
jgi:hypothetical protein